MVLPKIFIGVVAFFPPYYKSIKYSLQKTFKTWKCVKEKKPHNLKTKFFGFIFYSYFLCINVYIYSPKFKIRILPTLIVALFLLKHFSVINIVFSMALIVGLMHYVRNASSVSRHTESEGGIEHPDKGG